MGQLSKFHPILIRAGFASSVGRIGGGQQKKIVVFFRFPAIFSFLWPPPGRNPISSRDLGRYLLFQYHHQRRQCHWPVSEACKGEEDGENWSSLVSWCSSIDVQLEFLSFSRGGAVIGIGKKMMLRWFDGAMNFFLYTLLGRLEEVCFVNFLENAQLLITSDT